MEIGRKNLEINFECRGIGVDRMKRRLVRGIKVVLWIGVAVTLFGVFVGGFHRGFPMKGGARVQSTMIQLQTLEMKLKFYQQNTGAYPMEYQGLRALYERPVVLGDDSEWVPLLMRFPVVDGWGKEIRYEVLEDQLALSSAGPDGKFETLDDLQHQFSVRNMVGP